MKTKQLSLFALMLSFIAFSQSNPHQSTQLELSNDLSNSQQSNYKRISIFNPSESTISKLDALGIDLTCGVVIENNKLSLELFEHELDLLSNEGINYSVLIEDMQKYYSQRADDDLPKARMQLEQEKSSSTNKSYSVNEILNNVGQYNECDEIDWAVPANWNLNPNASPNSFGGCLTYDMVLQELDDMRAAYPNIVSVKTDASPTSQTSVEGRTVYYVRISDNPDTDEAGEPETLYQSLIHARESATVMNQLYFMWYLLENYATDDAIKNLVNNQALYFIPVYNPDGFVYNQTQAPNGGGGQRKNRNTSAPGSCSTYLDGIDLNRNSAYYWGNGGSSTNSCSDTFMGTAPFSEPETQIMRDFFLLHDFELALNHHSFKNAMLHAYAGTDITNPRPDEYSKYNHDMTYYNRYAHGPSTSISALNSGNMNDWMLGGPAGVSANGTPTGTGSGKNTMAWTPENGLSSEGGFWPAPSNFLPIAKRAMRMNFLAAYFSGKYAKLHDLNQSDISSLSGNLSFAIERLGQTDGDFTLTVTPVSSNILTVGGPSIQSGMTVLQQNNVNISYTLDPSIQANDEIEFKVVLTNDYASDNVLYEANIKKRYIPTVLFSDNPDTDNLTNWTTSGGTWSTTVDAFSGTTAITSTASIPYANNESKQIQMNGSVDLSGSSTALIQYFGKWDLERSFDYVQIEGSTNGTTWTPLCGKLTKPGASNANNSYSGSNDAGDSTPKLNSDNNFQPDGDALYDGDTQDKWNMEEIVIDATTNSFLFGQNTVFLRFNFNTESSNRKDSYANADFEGFSFDDFKVISFDVPCVESIPAGLNVTGITISGATINWDAILSTTYDIRYREIGTSVWTDANDLSTNSFAITGLSSLTDYEAQVRSKCSVTALSDYSTSINFTTLDIQVNYCTSESTNVNDEYISNVELNTIDNASGAQFYTDFTGISTPLIKNSQYTITVTPTWTGTIYNEAYSVWIDYNKDGDFDDSGEQVWTQGPTQNPSVSGSFTIPSTALETATTMRVSMKYNAVPTSCETFTWGEVEDYTVIIQSSVPDTTIPLIVLNGSSAVNLDLGDVYNELGATATDNIDGDITSSIVIGGDLVNPIVAGVYAVTYNVDDSSGNSAVEVIRTVNVNPDTTPPVISLIGSASVNLELGNPYTEQGATATDNIDGDITANIVVGGDIVNTNAVGVYIVTYNVNDAAGNSAAEVLRTITITPDVTIPVLTLIGSDAINLTIGDSYNELGATAVDNIDGDITANIVVAGDVVDTNTIGTYVVTYNVSDAAGNAANEITRTVNINVAPDTTPPVIVLNGASTIELDQGDVYNELGATATDNVDGDISGNIIIAGATVDTNTVGTYNVTYDVNDAAGNSAITIIRIVNVNAIPDTTPPVITLIGSTTINLELGTSYTEQGATATDNIDGDITANIVVGGDSVNTNAVGVYIVTYNVNDAAGNLATEVIRTVNVTPDVTIPVITLIGASTIDLNVGDTYNELGATATDNIDGDITTNIVEAGDFVDTNNAGTYLVTYNVNDAAGNAAIEVTRIVKVSEAASGCSGGISTFPYSEGFENTLGAWSQSANDDIDWTIDANGTPSNNTGPSSAIEGSFYVFVEASVNGTGYPSKQAILNSPCFDLNSLTEATFSFNYHMFGAADMGTIELELSQDEGITWISIWNESGNKGNSWQTVNIDISAYTGNGIQMRFNRITGSTWQADIALDNLSLIEGTPVIEECSVGISSYPYTEGFENTIGAWTQSTNDDINWTIDANGTPSSGTGPSSAVEGSFYLYVEASGNGTGYPNKQAIITSPCFDLTNESSASFAYNYHMYGSANAGSIELQVSNDNGISWLTLWSETGNNGNSWFSNNIDLASYLGQNIQLRFNRITGSTWQADVAIDGISLITSSGPTVNEDIPDLKTTIIPKVTVYPNPVNNRLTVSSIGFKPLEYKIFNRYNQLVLAGTFKKELDVSRLKSGVYHLKLISDREIIVKQFIKK